MAKINTTLFDNFNIDFDFYKSEYMEVNEVEEEDFNDNDVWEWIYSCLDTEWDDLFANIKYSKFADCSCVITGSVGTWRGSRDIYATPCDDIESAIRKCANNMDYIIIKQVNGHLEVEGIHHDGRNSFEIHLLNDKGAEAYYRIKYEFGNANLEKACYHKSMKDYLF